MKNGVDGWKHALVVIAGLLGACGDGDSQDPEGADRLLERVRSEDYRSWARAPGYETRRPAASPHSDEVDIFVNEVVEKALAGGPLEAWPFGSIIVKEGYAGGRLELVALMEKRREGWFFAEFFGDEAKFSGRPDVCVDCHASGDDEVRSFPLP